MPSHFAASIIASRSPSSMRLSISSRLTRRYSAILVILGISSDLKLCVGQAAQIEAAIMCSSDADCEGSANIRKCVDLEDAFQSILFDVVVRIHFPPDIVDIRQQRRPMANVNAQNCRRPAALGLVRPYPRYPVVFVADAETSPAGVRGAHVADPGEDRTRRVRAATMKSDQDIAGGGERQVQPLKVVGGSRQQRRVDRQPKQRPRERAAA